MKYNPDTARADVFPDGRYQAEITNAEERISKNNNTMLVVTAKLFNGATQQVITDYIVTEFAGPMQRLQGLCEACGLDFETGDINPASLVGKLVTVRLGTEKDESGKYPDKNRIWAYMPEGDSPPATQAAEAVDADAPADDDIPF